MKLDAILNAHAFMKVERPPELWDVRTEDEPFIRLLGEMIAAGLSKGTPLAELTLNASNVVVEQDDADESRLPPAGEYVAITVSGNSDFGQEHTWHPEAAPNAKGLLTRLHRELTVAEARYAYIRRAPSQGSLTVFYARERVD
jgi:hypothetical protein